MVCDGERILFRIIGEAGVFSPVGVVFPREVFTDKTSSALFPPRARTKDCLEREHGTQEVFFHGPVNNI